MKEVIGVGVVALASVVAGVALSAQQQAAEGANAVMPWAYTLGSSHKCMHDSGMISPITRRPKDEE